MTLSIHIGILGCRGIPNRYGGFEQFATHLSAELVKRGMTVSVYGSHNHPVQDGWYNGVQRISVYDPESWMGSMGQIWYDLLCILDARRRGFTIIYQLGYTSCGLWQWLLPAGVKIMTNMDGLEWSRAKYGRIAKAFLRWSEKRVALRSHMLVADALPVEDYLKAKYGKETRFLSYSADIQMETDLAPLARYGLEKESYVLVIARIQPDNHVEEAIEGVLMSGVARIVVVGNTANTFGKKLESRYRHRKVLFTGSIFDTHSINALRSGCRWYIHGHSAGGTNPSLLEAMAASARIIAHNNPFNRSVLKENAVYFSTSQEIAHYLQYPDNDALWQTRVTANLKEIQDVYNLPRLADEYAKLFKELTHTT